MRPTEVSIEWSVPSTPNGEITTYSVKCGSSQEPANTSLPHYKCMRLQPGSHYTITVTAYTIAGPGDVVSVQQKTPCEGNYVWIVKLLSCVFHGRIVLYLTIFFTLVPIFKVEAGTESANLNVDPSQCSAPV